MKILGATVIAVIVLAMAALLPITGAWAQQNPSPPQNYSEPLRLAVAEIQVITTFVPSGQPPNVEHLFHNPPMRAADAWARSHLRAFGSSHRASLIIRDASVVESKLDTKSGLSGFFSREPSEKYDAKLAVELEIRDNYDRFVGRVSAQVTRSQTVLEKTKPEELQKIWADMTAAMVNDLDRELSKQIRQHLSVFVE